MSGERGQNTTLRFGGVTAKVSLLKTSGKPKDAQHETRRVLMVPQETPGGTELPPALVPDPHDGLREAAQRAGYPVDPAEDPDPLGEPPNVEALTPEQHRERHEAGRASIPTEWDRPGDEVSPADDVRAGAAAVEAERDHEREQVDREEFAERVATSAPKVYTPPETDVQQGVHTDSGKWIDLTDRFAEIDERTKVDGLEVVATIASTAIPRERVRDAYYVGGQDPATFKVLALLWHSLRSTNRVAAVRFTKKTAQALGIIVPRAGDHPHLLLLELEWAENMRPVPRKASGPIGAAVEQGELAAAIELVEAFEAGPSAMNDLRDERLNARAELMEKAKAGQLDEFVAPPAPLPADLVDPEWSTASALDASAAWLREHAQA